MHFLPSKSHHSDLRNHWESISQMGKDFFPMADIVEKESSYVLDMDVPGMEDKDIDISFKNNVLTVKGEKRTESKNKEKDMVCIERSYGSFRRDIPFDEEIEADHIEAHLNKGVLHLEIPKKAQGKISQKKIPIKH